MGIDPLDLMLHVIRPASILVGMSGLLTEQLMLGTAIQESDCGTRLVQKDGVPALGIFQMEPATYVDHWVNYIILRPTLYKTMVDRFGDQPSPESMITDLLLAAAMCCIHYRRVNEPLPVLGDVIGLADYWKTHYNTHHGKGTRAEFVAGWYRIQYRKM